MNNQSRDIAKAITALQALQEKTMPAQPITMARQIDSYEQHKDVAKAAAQITIDFLTDICASAASLGNANDSAEIRNGFMSAISDALDDVFYDTDRWADEVREEFGLEAA